MVTTMTLKEFRAEQAERGVSAHDRLKHLIGDSERLRTRHRTDGEIMAIPENLAALAYEQSATLQEEFGEVARFLAYRRAMESGAARIAGVRR